MIPLGVSGAPPRWVIDLVEAMAGVQIHMWTGQSEAGHIRLPAGPWEGFIPRRGLVDPVAERERIDRQITRLQRLVVGSSAKLENPHFVERAPESVVMGERRKLAEASERLASFRRQREAL